TLNRIPTVGTGVVVSGIAFHIHNQEARYPSRMSRLVRGLIFLTITVCYLPVGTLVAQSRDELRQKYGEPTSETFIVRPGISVTATFGTNGRVTEFLITPRNTALIKSRGASLTMDSVSAIVDELVPRSVRRKRLSAEFINLECLPENDCYGTSDNYENVSIYYNATAEGRVHYAVVQLKQ